MNRDRLKVALTLGAFVCIAWGFTVPMPKLVTLPLPEHLFLRMGLGALVAMIGTGRIAVKEDLSKWGIFTIVCCSLGSPLFVASAAWGSPNISIYLAWTSAVWRGIFGRVFFHEKLTRYFGVRATLTLIAVVFSAVFSGGTLTVPSLLTGLGCGASMALWSAGQKKRGSEQRTDVGLGFLLAALCAYPFMSRSGVEIMRELTMTNVLGVFVTGGLAGAAYLVIGWSDKTLPPTTTLFICATEIFFGMGWTLLLLGRWPTWIEGIAGTLIFAVSIWDGWEAMRERKDA